MAKAVIVSSHAVYYALEQHWLRSLSTMLATTSCILQVLRTHIKNRMSVVASFYRFFWPDKGKHFFWPMRLVFIFLNILSWVLIFCSKLLISSLVFQEEEEVQQNVSVIICVLLYILSAHLLIYFFSVQVL